jgi:hypothetical protein
MGERQLLIMHTNGLFHISMTCAVLVFDVFDIAATEANSTLCCLARLQTLR